MLGRLLIYLACWTLAATFTVEEAYGGPASVDFELKGVLISPGGRSALINGRIVSEGERVNGVEVLAIEEGAVRVLTGTQEYTVLVGSSAWLRPSIARESRDAVRQVRRGDTLSGIAEEFAGDGITMNQVMVALFESNPDAFDGNINRLRAGAVLRIPGARDMRRHTPDTAMAEVSRQARSWRTGRTAPVLVVHEPAPPVDEYGPVRFGETLSEIAQEVAGDGISMNEMMVALFEANPSAFGDNIDLLHEGAVLRIPDVRKLRQFETLAARVD